MTAEEIRRIGLLPDSTGSGVDVVTDYGHRFLREIAAQLAELNETLKAMKPTGNPYTGSHGVIR